MSARSTKRHFKRISMIWNPTVLPFVLWAATGAGIAGLAAYIHAGKPLMCASSLEGASMHDATYRVEYRLQPLPPVMDCLKAVSGAITTTAMPR